MLITIWYPACGCGDFLLVAYRALRRLVLRILGRLHRELATTAVPRVHPSQLLRIRIDPFAVELARLTVRMGHLQAIAPAHPQDDREAAIVTADALLTPWPAASAIVGNPPFLDARKFATERPVVDRAALRRALPDVPGRADLCVYWLRKAHDHLRDGQRAGFLATNTIRQNYSREGGLDYILAHGGVITDAVATQVWPGDAAVHVSIVNWIKGPYAGPCELASQIGDAIAADLILTSNASGAAQTLVPLTGNGLLGPRIAVEPTPITLTLDPGTPLNQLLAITNSGDAALQWSATPSATLTGLVALTTSTGTVPAGANRQTSFNVNTTVSTAPGTITGWVRFTSNDITRASLDVPVTLIIPSRPRLTVTPSSVSFGNAFVGGSSSLSVQVRNAGNASLTISSIHGHRERRNLF